MGILLASQHAQVKQRAERVLARGYPEYEPSQPRDEHGRWSGGGGSSGSDSGSTSPKISPYRGPKPIVRQGPMPSQALFISTDYSGIKDTVELFINPKVSDVESFVRERMASRPAGSPLKDQMELRTLRDTHANVFLWDANDAIHADIEFSHDWDDLIDFDITSEDLHTVVQGRIPRNLRQILATGQEQAHKPEALAARDQAEKISPALTVERRRNVDQDVGDRVEGLVKDLHTKQASLVNKAGDPRVVVYDSPEGYEVPLGMSLGLAAIYDRGATPETTNQMSIFQNNYTWRDDNASEQRKILMHEYFHAYDHKQDITGSVIPDFMHNFDADVAALDQSALKSYAVRRYARLMGYDGEFDPREVFAETAAYIAGAKAESNSDILDFFPYSARYIKQRLKQDKIIT